MQEFITSSDMLTGRELKRFITAHAADIDEYKRFQKMYDTEPKIFDQLKKEPWKPDNRIAVNFARKIVDTFNGFSSSIPVKISHDDETINQAINDFWSDSHMDTNYSELAKTVDIKGISYVYLYQNEDSQTRIAMSRPEEMFVIFDDSIAKRKVFAVRYGRDKEEKLQGTLFTRTHALAFSEGRNGLEIESPSTQNAHKFNKVPVVYFNNNEEFSSLIKPVATMIDAYEKALSEKANDVDYFADAYLAILGAELGKDETAKIRDNRIINIFGTDDAAKIIVDFLDKPDGDTTQENLLDRLERLIYSISMVPDINNEKFGQESGIAREMKLQPMKYLANIKERKFSRGLDEIFQLFFSVPSNIPPTLGEEWKNVTYTFTRDMPKDIEGEINAVNNLEGTVSDETRLSLLSFVDNVQEEMDKLAAEYVDERQRTEGLMRKLTDSELANEY